HHFRPCYAAVQFIRGIAVFTQQRSDDSFHRVVPGHWGRGGGEADARRRGRLSLEGPYGSLGRSGASCIGATAVAVSVCRSATWPLVTQPGTGESDRRENRRTRGHEWRIGSRTLRTEGDRRTASHLTGTLEERVKERTQEL